jgi:hypothetical protein
MHRLMIQSKVVDDVEHKSELFETQFVFDDTGQNIGILELPAPQTPPGTS